MGPSCGPAIGRHWRRSHASLVCAHLTCDGSALVADPEPVGFPFLQSPRYPPRPGDCHHCRSGDADRQRGNCRIHQRTGNSRRTIVRDRNSRCLVYVLRPLPVEANCAAVVDAGDPAGSVGGILPPRLSLGMEAASHSLETCNPGRLMGTLTTSPPYFFKSATNFAEFPSSRKVRLSDP